MTLYRTDDDTKWGTGVGRNLTAVEVDGNFWELRQDVDDIVANPPAPREIVSITSSGNELTFTLSDDTTIGPVYMPVLEFHWRDEWTLTTVYQILDVFKVTGVGLYSVLQDHISPSVFDENFVVDGNPAYLKLFSFAATVLTDLGDVGITTPAAGQILRYNGTSHKWENVAQKYVIATNFNGIMSANQDLLHHRLAAGITFNANFADYLEYSCDGGAVANATASTAMTIALAPKATPNTFTDIGTITIASSSVTPTFATVGGTTKSGSKGDVLRIRGPASPDATLAGFYCTLVGRES